MYQKKLGIDKKRILLYDIVILSLTEFEMTFLTQEFVDNAVAAAEKWETKTSKMLSYFKSKDNEQNSTHDYIMDIVNSHCHNKNKKLGKLTLVFNTGSAYNCESLRRGQCQVGAACYALSDEKAYKSSLPYRERQARLWHFISPVEFASAIIEKNNARRVKCTHFRYSESGDFFSQEHLEWVAQVCNLLSIAGIVCYGYTARTDLDLDSLVKYSQVNASNTLYNFNPLTMNRFKVMLELSESIKNTCECSTGGNCQDCNMCKSYNGLVQVKKHK